jgi:hypothetical protein
MKSSMCGVTQQDALQSIIACYVSVEHALVSVMIAILRSSVFCDVDGFCSGRSSVLADIVSCW